MLEEPNAPVTDNTISGDLTPVDFDIYTPGIQVEYDQWGNVITSPTSPDPGRFDTLNDTTGSDLIEGQGGDDNITSNSSRSHTTSNCLCENLT